MDFTQKDRTPTMLIVCGSVYKGKKEAAKNCKQKEKVELKLARESKTMWRSEKRCFASLLLHIENY